MINGTNKGSALAWFSGRWSCQSAGIALIGLSVLLCAFACDDDGAHFEARESPIGLASAQHGTSGLLLEATSDANQPAESDEQLGDDVVARVNQVEILRDQLDARLDHRITVYRGSGQTPTVGWRNRERRTLVSLMVEQELLRQHIQELGLGVSAETVETALAIEIERVYRGERQFQVYLASEDLSRNDYRDNLRFQINLSGLIEQVGDVEASESEIRAYYGQFRNQWRAPARAQVNTVAFRLGRDADETTVEATQIRLSTVRERIVAGEISFLEAAEELGESTHRNRGGSMGWVYRDDPDLDARVADLLFSINVGDVSHPVRTLLGYQIFVVNERRAEGTRDFDEVRGNLVHIVEDREAQAFRTALVHHLEERYEVSYNEVAYGLEVEPR